jgi:hypothetical protein
MQSLFLVWIRSEVTTEAMWQDFNAKLATLVNWKATLTQWEEKVLQLTYILIEHTYPKPVVPEPKKKKGNVAEESEDNKEKEPEATTGGGDDKKKQSDRPMLTSSSSTGITSATTSIRFVKHSHFFTHPPISRCPSVLLDHAFLKQPLRWLRWQAEGCAPHVHDVEPAEDPDHVGHHPTYVHLRFSVL